MKRNLFIGIFLFFVSNNFGQSFTDLSFGEAEKLEILSWNVEWFPKNYATPDYVSEAIKNLDADIIAFQEIDDRLMFKQMVENIDGYEFYIVEDDWSGLALVYNTSSIEVLDIYEIYETKNREFPRAPLVMEFHYGNDKYILMNNHFKCCGDGYINSYDSWDEEKRRYDASLLLREYVNIYFPNDKVVIVGDLNDELTDNSNHNVFKPFLDQEENFLFADMEIANGSDLNWSYPSWPSHLDHILISNELYSIFEKESSSIETIKLDEYMSSWYNYDKYISDHRPVGIKLDVEILNGINLYSDNLKVYPIPSVEGFFIETDCSLENTMLEIYNTIGQVMHSELLKTQKTWVNFNPKMKSGIYFLKLYNNKGLSFTQKIIVEK